MVVGLRIATLLSIIRLWRDQSVRFVDPDPDFDFDFDFDFD